jgi:hypothetical protein
VDGLAAVDEAHEAEADRFANDQLMPPAAALKLEGLRSEQEVKAAAKALGIAPGIVVGRKQHEGWVPRTHLNGLKVSYHWTGGKAMTDLIGGSVSPGNKSGCPRSLLGNAAWNWTPLLTRLSP